MGEPSRIFDPRLGANVLKIIQIEKHIEKIKDRLEEAKQVDVERFVHEMSARLDSLETSHCGDREFQCGGENAHECISDLFVCDGQPDCHNHQDEDDDFCSIEPVRPGRLMKGIEKWTGCIDAKITEVFYNQTVVSLKRSKHFPSIAYLRFFVVISTVIDDKEIITENTYEATYSFADRHLLMRVDDEEDHFYGFLFICHFARGDNDRAVCEAQMEGSKEVCATGTFVSTDEEDFVSKHDDDESEA